MSLNITRGTLQAAVKAVIYGVEGIGKSTLAAGLPNPVFVDVEGGTKRLDVARIECATEAEMKDALRGLINTDHGFQTVVLDTADWAEKLHATALIEEARKKDKGIESIEDFGYGKGYTFLAERFGNTLAMLDQLVRKGVHVVVLAHAKVSKISPPDLVDGYDKYELKLSKQSSPLLKEWAEMVLFANFSVRVKKGADGKKKGEGGTERCLFSTPSAAYDAKNRFGLEDCLLLEPASIAHIFGAAPVVAAAPAVAPEQGAPVPVTLLSDKQHHYIVELFTQLLTPTDKQAKAAEWASKGRVSDVAELSGTEAGALIQWLRDKVAGVQAPPPAQEAKQPEPEDDIPMHFPSDLEFLKPHAAKAVAYAEKKGWIKAGQDLANIPTDKIAQIVAKKDAFLRAIGA